MVTLAPLSDVGQRGYRQRGEGRVPHNHVHVWRIITGDISTLGILHRECVHRLLSTCPMHAVMNRCCRQS